MNQDNSSYTVTAPDLYMTEHGISIFISSTSDELVDSIKSTFETVVATSIVFSSEQKN